MNSSVMPIPLSLTTTCVRTNISPFEDGASSWYKDNWMLPPSGVYLTAFDSKFINTWFKRTLSQYTSSATMLSMCTMPTMLSTTSRREIRSTVNVILPLSIFDMSSTSLISPSKCLLDSEIFLREFCTCSLSSICAVAIAVMPTIALIGGRMDILKLERD